MNENEQIINFLVNTPLKVVVIAMLHNSILTAIKSRETNDYIMVGIPET